MAPLVGQTLDARRGAPGGRGMRLATATAGCGAGKRGHSRDRKSTLAGALVLLMTHHNIYMEDING